MRHPVEIAVAVVTLLGPSYAFAIEFRLPYPFGFSHVVSQGNDADTDGDLNPDADGDHGCFRVNRGSCANNAQYAIDFSMGVGSDVVAAEAGIVSVVKMDSNVGGCDKKFNKDTNQIVIDHADGTQTAYLHLQYQSARVVVGQTVTRGQPLAESGNTGWSCGPHLHFQRQAHNKQSVPVSFTDVVENNGVPIATHTYISGNGAACFFEVHNIDSAILWGSNLGVYATRVAQKFVPQTDVTLSMVNHRVTRSGTPSDSVHLHVYAEGVNPDQGTLIAGPISVPAGSVGNSDYTSFRLPTPILLRANTPYWFTFSRDVIEASGYYSHLRSSGSEYSYSQAWAFDPSGPGWILIMSYTSSIKASLSLQLCGP